MGFNNDGHKPWWPQTMTATNNDHDGHNHDGHKQWSWRPQHDGHKQWSWRPQPWRPQTLTTIDITWWNLSNDAMNLAISYKYAVSFSHFHCCGRHGLWPSWYSIGPIAIYHRPTFWLLTALIHLCLCLWKWCIQRLISNPWDRKKVAAVSIKRKCGHGLVWHCRPTGM